MCQPNDFYLISVLMFWESIIPGNFGFAITKS